jgi:SAM-dependent methyltransferase
VTKRCWPCAQLSPKLISSMSCNPDLRYLQQTPAGANYVSQITAQLSDRRTRSTFRDLVLSIAPPGAHLFDFGAGPGIDALFFAERGFTIDAYDIDPRMREFFADHCQELIDSGRVKLDGSDYQEFLAHGTTDSIRLADLVISNFAPLNLVDDLRALFGKFHALTRPKGKVLASVLTPCFIGDMRSRLWWRGAPRLWREGELFLPGPQAPYYRRLLRNFRAVSAPHFTLNRVFRGIPTSRGHSKGIDLQRDSRLAWLHIAKCRYMFLLFEKTD